MEVPKGSGLVRILSGVPAAVYAPVLDGHALDVLPCRDLLLQAEQVRAHQQAHCDRARGHDAHPRQALLPEHPPGLFQQHGGRIVSQQPRQEQAHRHGQRVGVIPPLEDLAPQQLIQQPPDSQSAEQRHAVPEDGPQPPEGHHISGALAVPLFVEEPAQRQQSQPRQGVQRRHPQAPQVGDHHALCRTLDVDFNAVVELDNGGEDAQPPDALQHGHADEEDVGQIGHQHLQHKRQEVCQYIEHRQHKGVARQHGAQRPDAGEQQDAEQHRQHRVEHADQVKEPPAQGDKTEQSARDREGNHLHGHSRQRIGDEQARPVHGQGVHHPHRPGVIQVPPHRHDTEDGIGADKGGDEVGRHLVQGIPELAGAVREILNGIPILHQGQLQVQGDHGAHQGHDAPQRPEAAQMLLKQGDIKEGSL